MTDEVGHARRMRALREATQSLQDNPRVDDIAAELLIAHIRRQIDDHRRAISQLQLQLDLLHLVRYPEDEELAEQVFGQTEADA